MLKTLMLLLMIIVLNVACDNFDYDSYFKGLFLLGCITGVIPCAVVILIQLFYRMIKNASTKIAETDYTPIAPEDKREKLLNSLAKYEKERNKS